MMLSGLLGGLLKGEGSSWGPDLLNALVVFAVSGSVDEVDEGFRNLSSRGLGGGGGCLLSRFSSPDRLGGGGDGGPDGLDRCDRVAETEPFGMTGRSERFIEIEVLPDSSSEAAAAGSKKGD